MNKTIDSTNAPRAIDSKEAYRMLMASPSNTFILDVRTRAEYEFVGHPDLPNGVANIPLVFYDGWRKNSNFIADVIERYDKASTILTICRSGQRAETAAWQLLKTGFKKLYYISDSFEGISDEVGHRTINGWKNNALPYTHSLDDSLIYR